MMTLQGLRNTLFGISVEEYKIFNSYYPFSFYFTSPIWRKNDLHFLGSVRNLRMERM